MLRAAHFYHIWTGGNWQAIAAEHATALKDSKFDGNVFRCEISDGYEDVTLNRLHQFCLTTDPDTPVLYAHVKGSFRKMYLRDVSTHTVYPGDLQELWRQHMTDRLVRAWRARVDDLRNYDIVGCHWVAPADSPSPYFAGNFWWARAGYIATLQPLPVLDSTNRWKAERWLASGKPRVKALSEGFDSIPVPPAPGATAVEWWTEEARVD